MAQSLQHFVCIGPGRSGTSWLFEQLNEHPQISMSDIKETQYFDKNFSRGNAWYMSHFHVNSQTKVIGEISNEYYFTKSVLDRIANYKKKIKILICLRNPYDRMVSTFKFDLRRGGKWPSLTEAVRCDPYYLQSLHLADIVRNYCERFPNSVYLLLFDRIEKEPHNLIKEIYHFLEVNEAFQPSRLNRKVNESVVPRMRLYGIIAREMAWYLRAIGANRLLTGLKRSDRIKRIFFRPTRERHADAYTDELYELVDKQFSREILELQKLALPLEINWKHPKGCRWEDLV